MLCFGLVWRGDGREVFVRYVTSEGFGVELVSSLVRGGRGEGCRSLSGWFSVKLIKSGDDMKTA